MDLRTGQTYETKDAALAAGVPESDIAEIDGAEVRFSSGPFKGRVYRRTRSGLVRVDRPSGHTVEKTDSQGNVVRVRA